MRTDISNWEEVHREDRGVNEKVWVQNPETQEKALYKETQIKENLESTYADYAESIVSDISQLLDVPAARIELVQKDGKNGCISYSFCDPDFTDAELVEIGTVISNIRPEFDSKSMVDKATGEGYGVEMILEAVEDICPDKKTFREAKKNILRNILIDSLVDHYDRNPSNISVIRHLKNSDGNKVEMSPKYDNGTSLSIAVPVEVLAQEVNSGDTRDEIQRKIRENVFSKIGFLGWKYVRYDDLETFIFNYYDDETKDFVGTIEEKLTDENIEKILSQEKYADLSDVHKEIIRTKLMANRDSMLQRYRKISKKKIIDKIIFNKNARNNFQAHVQKGTIQEVLPEYNETLQVQDKDSNYDMTLEEQIPEKIQTIVDITQLSRYLGVEIEPLTKREKNLLKWTVIIENLQKASGDENVLDNITERLGFLSDDKETIRALIRGKFKDEHDIVEATDMIYGENGLGEKNVNLYFAKKFVDAATMKKSVRDERITELNEYAKTMKEAVELWNVRSKIPISVRTLQQLGMNDHRGQTEIFCELGRMYLENPRNAKNKAYEVAKRMVAERATQDQVHVGEGVFLNKDVVKEIDDHTYELQDGKKMVIFERSTKIQKQAMKYGIDYYVQICEHPSGSGVTLSAVSKNGLRFPDKFDKFAKKIVEKYGDGGKNGIIYREPTRRGTASVFAVSCSGNNADTKIPNVTTREMSEQIQEMFGVKQRDKIVGVD